MDPNIKPPTLWVVKNYHPSYVAEGIGKMAYTTVSRTDRYRDPKTDRTVVQNTKRSFKM